MKNLAVNHLSFDRRPECIEPLLLAQGVIGGHNTVNSRYKRATLIVDVISLQHLT